MTRGQFWPMFATYALATCSVLVVVMLALVIFTAVTAIATGGDLKAVQNMTQPDMGSLGSYFTPRMIAYTAFGALLTAVYYAVVVAPAAVIYQRLKALRPSSLVEL